jgi:hypothetical protein
MSRRQDHRKEPLSAQSLHHHHWQRSAESMPIAFASNRQRTPTRTDRKKRSSSGLRLGRASEVRTFDFDTIKPIDFRGICDAATNRQSGVVGVFAKRGSKFYKIGEFVLGHLWIAQFVRREKRPRRKSAVIYITEWRRATRSFAWQKAVVLCPSDGFHLAPDRRRITCGFPTSRNRRQSAHRPCW